MSRRRPRPDLADELDPEDGVDPKVLHAKPWDAPKQAGRKARQLCEQVKDALHGALAACADPVLQALSVIAVEPAPHTGRLLVRVAADGADRDEAAAHLQGAAGVLRGETARAINRRHAPELTFEVV